MNLYLIDVTNIKRNYSLLSSHSFNINYIFSLLLSLQFLIYPNISQTTTQPNIDDPNEDNGQYTSIYLTMIIIFSVLFVVVIFCLIYRIYKKRQEEHIDSDSNNKQSTNDKKMKGTTTSTSMYNKENGSNENGMSLDEDGNGMIPEQVKFRGSMSSVENRHERVPSKPVVISITTPKGTRHVADAFGEYDGQEPDKENELPEIDEDEEEEYNNNHQDQGGGGGGDISTENVDNDNYTTQ